MSDVDTAARSCPWCSATAPAEATSCPACGAALAQRESLGEVQIPGLTSVHPALLDADGRPMRIPGPSASQGVASGAIVAAAMGGPAGLAILGGVAAVAAAEYIGASRGGTDAPDIADVGRPSEIALLAIQHLDGGEDATPDGDDPAKPAAPQAVDPWRDLPPAGGTEPGG